MRGEAGRLVLMVVVHRHPLAVGVGELEDRIEWGTQPPGIDFGNDFVPARQSMRNTSMSPARSIRPLTIVGRRDLLSIIKTVVRFRFQMLRMVSTEMGTRFEATPALPEETKCIPGSGMVPVNFVCARFQPFREKVASSPA